MRSSAIIAACVIVALFATLAHAGAPVLSSCSGADSLLQNVKVTTDSPNWAPGTTSNLILSGTITESFTGGQMKVVATFMGMNVKDETTDLCTAGPIQCPVTLGEKSWSFPVAIPSIGISGELVAKTELTTTDGKLIACTNVKVSL